MWQHDLHQKVTPMDLSPALTDKSTVANQRINTGNVAGLKQQTVSSGGTIKNFLSATKEFAANIAATGNDIIHGTIKNYKTRQQNDEGRNLYAAGISLAIKGNDQEKYLYRAIAEGYALISGMELAIELGIRYEGPTLVSPVNQLAACAFFDRPRLAQDIINDDQTMTYEGVTPMRLFAMIVQAQNTHPEFREFIKEEVHSSIAGLIDSQQVEEQAKQQDQPR